MSGGPRRGARAADGKRDVMKTTGLDPESLEMTLQSLRDFAEQKLPVARLLQLDHDDEFPEDSIRELCDPATPRHPAALHPRGVRRHGRERLRRLPGLRVDGARSTSAWRPASWRPSSAATPSPSAATEEQKKHWLGRIAEEGLLFAYGATEPAAGSDLGALKTTATPVVEDGKVTGYRLNGRKQWISNGGVADVYTILANAPGGPTWFIAREGRPRASRTAKPEDKHGIRASNTAALSLTDVWVPVGNLVGGVEGQGLLQAQLVFGYTRLMVAAFGLGAGWAALDRAIPYSKERIQGGGSALREAGLHAQAHRPPRRPPRGGARLHRGDRRAASTRARSS